MDRSIIALFGLPHRTPYRADPEWHLPALDCPHPTCHASFMALAALRAHLDTDAHRCLHCQRYRSLLDEHPA